MNHSAESIVAAFHDVARGTVSNVAFSHAPVVMLSQQAHDALLDKANHQDAALSLLRELRDYYIPAQEQFAPVLGRIDALLNDKP